MARYLEVAADARETIDALMAHIPEDRHEVVAPMIAHIYNYGIRTAPRAVQSTVRYNAVRTACLNLPVKIAMEKRKDERTGKEFNVLQVHSIK